MDQESVVRGTLKSIRRRKGTSVEERGPGLLTRLFDKILLRVGLRNQGDVFSRTRKIYRVVPTTEKKLMSHSCGRE